MPKVSPTHLAARRQQILAAAMTVFAERGFASATMQQITKHSGMSAGAVYHYFPTKHSLIQATADHVAHAYLSIFPGDAAEQALSPSALVQQLAEGLTRIHGESLNLTRIGIFAWAEALRDPQAAQSLKAMQNRLRQQLAEHVRRWQQSGAVTPEVAEESVVATILALITGFSVSLNLGGTVTAQQLAAGAAAMGATTP